MTAKTVLERFGAKGGDRVAVVGASEEERALLGPLPEGAQSVDAVADATVTATFVRSREELVSRYAEQLPVLAAAKAVWVVYPKGGRADVNRDSVAGEAREHGWRGISNIAVDDTWSAVRVRPLNDGAALRDGAYLEPEDLNDTNLLDVFVYANDKEQQALLVARLDNLGKGASGAAVQNMNLMLGLPETAGLTQGLQ